MEYSEQATEFVSEFELNTMKLIHEIKLVLKQNLFFLRLNIFRFLNKVQWPDEFGHDDLLVQFFANDLESCHYHFCKTTEHGEKHDDVVGFAAVEDLFVWQEPEGCVHDLRLLCNPSLSSVVWALFSCDEWPSNPWAFLNSINKPHFLWLGP